MKRIAIIAAGLFAAGCGKEASAPPNTQLSPSPSGSVVTLATLDTVTQAKSPYKIVLIVKTRNNPFFRPMIDEFEKTVKALGAVPEVQAPPQEMDYEKQVALIQTEVSKGAQAICIAPADSKGIVPALLAAQKKGVIIVNLDNRIDGPSAAAQGLSVGGYVGADNEAGGRLAGEEMARALAKDGKVAILEGIRGADNAEARKRGFSTAVAGKLTIVASESANWDTEQAYQKTQNVLQAHKDIQGIFCANDKMAVGAIKAISENGRKGKIVVIGYDNIPDVRPALQDGGLRATIEQHPDLMGKYGARMAVGILNGSVPKGGEILVPLDLVRKR